MGNLLVEVAFYGVAAAVAAPVAIVVGALIVGAQKRPVIGSLAFTAGAAALDVSLAAIVLASGAFESGGDSGAWLDVALGVFFAIVGIVALIGKDSPEKDAARRARAQQLAKAPLPKLFVVGLAVQVINFDALAVFGGAAKEIAEANVTTGEAVFAAAFGLLIMLCVYYVPAVIYVIAPDRAGVLLKRMSEWIIDNSRMIEIVTGLAFGAMFLGKGLTAL